MKTKIIINSKKILFKKKFHSIFNQTILGLKKANFIAQCLTKQSKPTDKNLEVNIDNDDSVYKPTELEKKPSKKEPQPSPTKTGRFLSFWQKPSRTQSTPSLADPKPLSLRRPSENDLTLDPVEEAIKSLENFGEFGKKS